MTRGKKTCKILKEIRKQIAEKNNIEYITSECGFQGECKGTCPKCEQEVRYLESELRKRQQLGKVVTIAGISLGVAGTFAACDTATQQNENTAEQKVTEQPLETPKLLLVDSATIDTLIPVQKRTHTKPIALKGDILIEEATELNMFIKIGYVQPKDIISTGIVELYKPHKRYIYSTYNIDKAPSFPNGDGALQEFITENLVYPQKAINKSLEGTTVVRFVVNANGNVRNPKVIQSSYKMLDKQALSMVKKLPRFTPGENYGEKVRAYYELPVVFKLPKEKEFVFCDTVVQQTENHPIEPKLPKTPEVVLTHAADTVKVDSVALQNTDVQKYVKPATILKTKPDKGYVEAEFPGGVPALMRYLDNHINYPIFALELGISGTVIVKFIVTAEGSIENAKILKGIHPSLDKEVIRVVQLLPLWQPAIVNGK
ncbi:MAG: TonB family protein, partial [Bacteroidales bacterium]|nr:TonB family protein [Bacteroidales bacterium]